MNIALIGPSGVGKGTHVADLSARYRLRHVATGDLFRSNLRDRTPLGILARRYMEAGDLVPDEVVDSMVEAWSDSLPKEEGILFDGFPRTQSQAQFLDELLGHLGRQLDALVYLQVSDEEVVSRLAGRLICRACQASYHVRFHPPAKAGVCDVCGGVLYQRSDDTPELARRRLRSFNRELEPLLELYAAKGKLIIISGEGSIAEVRSRLVSALDGVEAGRARFAGRESLRALLEPAAPGPRADGLNLVLLGGPGSGKGTQAQLLAARLRLPHISTGDLFRENLRDATELGLLAKSYMDRGELVPDNLTEEMVEERLGRVDARAGFILDGFPRSLAQAVALEEMLGRMGRRVTGAVSIDVPDATIIERLSGRLICRVCQAPYHVRFHPPRVAGVCDRCGGELYQRSDDNPETVRARLITFHRQAEPLIEYYRKAGIVRSVSGEEAVESVHLRSLDAVSELAAKSGVAMPVEILA